MPRDLSLGNGSLQINFDPVYALRDVFFPYVGQENHTVGTRGRLAVWSNGRLAWADGPQWERELLYEENAAVTNVRLYHARWNLEIVFNDAVDADENLFLRRVKVTNNAQSAQDIRLFFDYDFRIKGATGGDTIFYDPNTRTMIAYKDDQYFSLGVSGEAGYGVSGWNCRNSSGDPRSRNASVPRTGELARGALAQGSVGGTVELGLGSLPPGESTIGYHWLAAGGTKLEVDNLGLLVRRNSPQEMIERTGASSRAWVGKEAVDLSVLRPETIRLYNRSLLTVRTQTDERGAIIASTDSDSLNFAGNSYAYSWPRDGALVALAMDRAGYGDLTRRYFDFCGEVFNPNEGYFLQRYTPPGHVASTWHPWIGEDGVPQLPIQEDETGLILFSLWEHYQRYKDIDFVRPLYQSIVVKSAEFMLAFRDQATNLPLPSHDLWEERYGVHVFSVAAVWAGLDAAAHLSEIFNRPDDAARYRKGAEEVREATVRHFWDESRGQFSQMLTPRVDGGYDHNSTLDASAMALTLYGMLPPDDPKMRATAKAIHERLWCQGPIGGIARYEDDAYYQVSKDIKSVPGNPWFICTLWVAQYYATSAKNAEDLKQVEDLLSWAERHAEPSGILAEQLNPDTGESLSVSPLTWSHAEFVSTVHTYLAARARLGVA